MNKLVINLTNNTAELVPLTEAEIAAQGNATLSVPSTVTTRQIRLWLHSQGKLDAVTAAIAAIPDPTQRTAAQIEWEWATVIERAHPLTGLLGTAIGLSSADLDQAFREAALL